LRTLPAQTDATSKNFEKSRKMLYYLWGKKYIEMEIINIEAKTFEAMLSKFEGFAKSMEHLVSLHSDREMSEWMDNQDVCFLLKISPRTLQTLRDNGTLAYSQISHKTYYKPEDVKKIVPLVENRRKEASFKEKTI
jgi:hypothetical protein